MDPGRKRRGKPREGADDEVLTGIDGAISHLADLEARDDMEALGTMLEALVTRAEMSFSGDPDAQEKAALKRLREARDLLDDGEPADTVALELMAARDLLRRR